MEVGIAGLQKVAPTSHHKGESIATFVAALRELGEHCGYGETLPDMIRDRLVCGVNYESIQKRLLSKKNLTYAIKGLRDCTDN